MPLKREDTEKALQAMEACQSAADEGFRVRAEKLLHIFQSDLFQALLDHVSQAGERGWHDTQALGVTELVKLLPVTLTLDIQEFYELTVVENQGVGMLKTPVLVGPLAENPHLEVDPLF
ncbi:hypothetical protein AAFF_G00156730 [Aldrovandia affinis]|uniref:L27-1 domain-containing protein n=1 Tax=Aldrovandia affinis TaxID=143900 RepID=A0AAD7W8L4_9TELE|nr:hypothetical protein AAFF_G00156730 [Aldrovandia affinis]